MKRYGYVNPKSSHLIMDGIFRTLSNFSFVIECILHLNSPLLGAWDEFKKNRDFNFLPLKRQHRPPAIARHERAGII